MATAQGRMPKIVLLGRMCGKDTNNNTTNNSIEYRGRPYARENCLDQVAQDFQREQSKTSWQNGLRVLNIYLTTGTISVIN